MPITLEAKSIRKPVSGTGSDIAGQEWSSIRSLLPESEAQAPFPPISLCLMGKEEYGFRAYEALKRDGHVFHYVFAPADPNDPLRQAVLKDNEGKQDDKKIKLIDLTEENLANEEYGKDMKERLHTRLGVMAYVTEHAGEEILNAPELGTIEFHPSGLPKGRGIHAINHTLIRGDDFIELVTFGVNEVTDGGPVARRVRLEVLKTDTVGSLYYGAVLHAGVMLLADTVRQAARGEMVLEEQDEMKVTDEDPIWKRNAGVNWNKTSDELYNYFRGTTNIGPFTQLYSGEEIELPPSTIQELGNPRDIINLSKLALISEAYPQGKPGEIMDITTEGIVVATKDGVVMIREMQKSRLVTSRLGHLIEISEGKRGEVMKPIDFAEQYGLTKGMIFTSLTPDSFSNVV